MIGLRMRWMIRSDIAEVLEIAGVTGYPLTYWSLDGLMRRRNVIGIVALDLHRRVVGFALYDLRPDRLHVLRLGVGPYVRRQGVGRAMVAALAAKLLGQRRRIVVRIREHDAPALAFFRAQGFRGVTVDRGYYPETGEDAYRLEFVAPAPSTSPSPAPSPASPTAPRSDFDCGDCRGKDGFGWS